MMKPEVSFVFRQNHDCAALRQALAQEGYHTLFLEDESEKSDIVVTDDENLARRLRKNGRCVIGYQDREGSRKGEYFHGADYVLTSGDASGVSFIGDVWRRFLKIPYTVGETKRLIIRESIPGDFSEIYRITEVQRRGEGCEGLGQVFREDESAGREESKQNYLSYIGTVYRFFGFGLWTILRKDTGRIIGRCGLSPQADDFSPEGRIELGYLIDRKERRKGYAFEACQKIVEFSFSKLEVPELYVRIDEKNIPSAMLAEKLGFRKDNDRGDGTWLWVLKRNMK